MSKLFPGGWTLVPDIGTYVEADHPITCTNPMKAFEVRHVKCENGRWYARGENTMWFGVAMLTTASAENAMEAEELMNLATVETASAKAD